MTTQLWRLERELGARLVDRSQRAIGLTSAGQLFLAEARTALAQLEHAAVVARRAGRGEAGTLRIGYVISAACAGVLQTLPTHHRRSHPGVQITLQALAAHHQHHKR